MKIYHRKSLRLWRYDYKQIACYFITICTRGRIPYFGKCINGFMSLNMAGCMVWHWYRELENKYIGLKCHEMVVMPDHVHFILEITETNPQEGNGNPDGFGNPDSTQRFATQSGIPAIIQWFKTMTTNAYIQGVKTRGWKPFHKKLWLRSYYDIIIRDEKAFQRISRYILNNPGAKHP